MSGGGGQGSGGTTTQQAYPYAPAMPYILQGMQDAANIFSQGPTQYTPWSQVSGFTPEQLAAQQGIMNYTGSQGTQEYIRNAQGATERQLRGGQNYVQPLMGGAQSQLGGYIGNNQLASNVGALNQLAYGDSTNPYTESQVRSSLDQLSNQFLSNTLPQLRRAAIGQGTYGSSRNALAEGQAGGALEAQMQQAANKANMEAYQTAENNRLGALQQMASQQNQGAQTAYNLLNQGAGTNLENIGQGLGSYIQALSMPLDMYNQQMQVGQAQQAQAQSEIGDATNRWNFQQNAGWDTLAKFKNLIDATSNLGGTSATSSSAPPSNIVGNVAGGILQALPMAASMMSSGGGNAAAGQSGAAGSGTSGWASPSSLGFQSGSANIPAAPAIGSSNWGGSIGSNTSWAPSKW